MDFREEFLKYKKEKNAVLLAHFYQVGEIQDIADFVGDSLGLAQKASEVDADIIVFAGVHFMAETAKILNPDTKVLLPDMEAGCSLAESCPPGDFKKFKEKHPDHIVISYINCTAAIKTMSDVICTSSNAKQIVESFPQEQKIIFAPDKNLGAYINNVTGRDMVLWDGTCEVHDVLETEAVIKLKLKNPDAKLIAHPECKSAVLELADFVGSTTAMLNFTKTDKSKKYVVATETGILHQMRKESPDKQFIIVPTDETCSCNDCPYMKLNTMQKLYLCLKNERPEIVLSEETIEQAKKPIEKMLEISRRMKLI
ncbi:MAG: quinolinate synthase NadA [Bacteroidales bacterium]|nr:quinolinate synthase NadA [Bacteroidales bacterium]MCF8343057.1 quinolinate synthase NadA [Bacteroidales bacterium]MCF8349800.1 quinolinate synthase NadA [Bacteroidales bacterium]MCF8375920.1 quinolinate synthase NadA [Bacteroidales bacterium]